MLASDPAHLEDVDGCVVDVIFEQILDPPADRRLELVRGNLRRFHQQYLVVRGLEERGADETGEAVLLRLPLQRIRLLGWGARDTPPARREGPLAARGTHMGELDRFRLDCDGQKS